MPWPFRFLLLRCVIQLHKLLFEVRTFSLRFVGKYALKYKQKKEATFLTVTPSILGNVHDDFLPRAQTVRRACVVERPTRTKCHDASGAGSGDKSRPHEIASREVRNCGNFVNIVSIRVKEINRVSSRFSSSFFRFSYLEGLSVLVLGDLGL